MSENKFFTPKFMLQMEYILMPLFEYLAKPKEADFDEEILVVVSSFIKMSKQITPAMKKMFPYY